MGPEDPQCCPYHGTELVEGECVDCWVEYEYGEEGSEREQKDDTRDGGLDSL